MTISRSKRSSKHIYEARRLQQPAGFFFARLIVAVFQRVTALQEIAGGSLDREGGDVMEASPVLVSPPPTPSSSTS
jgi:hypothetical protein